MKTCPACNQEYADASLNFCLADGTGLIVTPDSSQETIVMSPPLVSERTQQIRKGVSPLIAYLAIGLFALVAGGGIVAWIMSLPSYLDRNNRTAEIDLSRNPNAGFDNLSSNQDERPSSKTPANSVSRDLSAIQGAQAALEGWVQSLVEHDLNRHLSFYADRLEVHRKMHDVDISYVRQFNEKLFSKYSKFDLKIQNVRSNMTDDGQVITTFESLFDYKGTKGVHSGKDPRTEMRWKKIDGSWKIVSEM